MRRADYGTFQLVPGRGPKPDDTDAAGTRSAAAVAALLSRGHLFIFHLGVQPPPARAPRAQTASASHRRPEARVRAPLVLSGHAASLTPYKSDTPRLPPRTNARARSARRAAQDTSPLVPAALPLGILAALRARGPPGAARLGGTLAGSLAAHLAWLALANVNLGDRTGAPPPPLPTVAPTRVPTVHSLC